MCTVSFLPRSKGFLLAVNRDEKWTRGARSHPPLLTTVSGISAALPHDAQGGTWIALNEYGLAFTILNRNFSGPSYAKTRSRAWVIPLLLNALDTSDALARLDLDKVKGVLPFTLVVVSALEQRLVEVTFDGENLAFLHYSWQRQHWFSSGLSDIEARAHRGTAVESFSGESDLDTIDWVRRLHRSHAAGDAFSVCVHREFVGSVSYTEIDVEDGEGRISYSPGPPCTGQAASSIYLPIRTSQEKRTRR